MRKPAKKRSKLLTKWNSLRDMLQKGDPRRIFVGRFSSEKTRIIQTAKNSPKRRQKVTRRQRLIVARKKRIMRAATVSAKLAISAAILILLAMSVFDYMTTSPRFSVSHIAVIGNSHVTADEIIAQSGISEGENMFSVKLTNSASAIGLIPWIREAKIWRTLPNQISIEVTERKPFALLLAGELFYIDDTGRVLAPFDSSQDINGPVVTGTSIGKLKPGDNANTEGIADAMEIVRLAVAMDITDLLDISEINIDDPSDIVIVTARSGTNVRIGSGDLKGKLWRLSRVARAITKNEQLREADTKSVDMRFKGIVPVKFEGG